MLMFKKLYLNSVQGWRDILTVITLHENLGSPFLNMQPSEIKAEQVKLAKLMTQRSGLRELWTQICQWCLGESLTLHIQINILLWIIPQIVSRTSITKEDESIFTISGEVSKRNFFSGKSLIGNIIIYINRIIWFMVGIVYHGLHVIWNSLYKMWESPKW